MKESVIKRMFRNVKVLITVKSLIAQNLDAVLCNGTVYNQIIQEVPWLNNKGIIFLQTKICTPET